MTTSPTEKDELITEIIRRTLDRLADWQPAKLMPGIGPKHPEVHREFRNRIEDYRLKVRVLLAKKTTEELQSVYLRDVGSGLNPLTQRKGIHYKYAKELDKLHRARPPWFAGGWSVGGYLLDAEYWRQASVVSVYEAALMLVGVDPREIDYKKLFTYYGRDRRSDEILYFLEDRFELLVRRFGDPDEGTIKVLLSELCHWIEKEDIGVSFELKKIVSDRAKHALSRGSKTAESDDDARLHGSSRKMFQRALLVAAVDSYGVRERGDAAQAAKRMVAAGDYLGFNLDQGKLAQHIRAGFLQLGEDALEYLKEKELKNEKMHQIQ